MVDDAEASAIGGAGRRALAALMEQAARIRDEIAIAQTGEVGPFGGPEDIPVIGGTFTGGQILRQTAEDIREMVSVAARLLNGAAGRYLGESERDDLAALLTDLDRSLEAIPEGLEEDIPAEMQAMSREHMAFHYAEPLSLVEAAERLVVSAEAGPDGIIPILEPLEVEQKRRDKSTEAVAGLAALAAAGAILWAIFG
jgi:hypothetical protein